MMNVTEIEFQTTVARCVGGEDLRPKDMIAVLNNVIEWPSFFWQCSGSLLPADEPVRIVTMPDDPGKPFQVVAICLPFVYAKDFQGNLVTFDTRQHHLVRLDKQTARKIWKKMRKAVAQVPKLF